MAVQVLSPHHHCLKNLPTTPQTPFSPLIIYRPKTKNPNPNPSPNRQAIQAPPNCRKQQKPRRTNNINSLPAKNQRGGELTRRPSALAPQKVQEFRFYAGSCYSSASPPPISLPVPSFLAKK